MIRFSKWSLRNKFQIRRTIASSTPNKGLHTPRDAQQGPLTGMRVLDSGCFLAGPIVGMYLASYGAEVIKVEKPGRGDDARAVGPFANGDKEASSYFMSPNRGKKSITLNLKSPEGVEIYKKLASTSDVLIENYIPGVMDRLGIGYEDLKEANPRLIYAAVSGFDKNGPDATRPAFDTLLQAAGGLISVTGHPEEGKQVRVGVSIVDICSGLYTFSGVLTAIIDRDRTGLGKRVDTTMLSVVANLMENPISRFAATGIAPTSQGLAHPVVSPFNAFTTSDGSIYVAIANTARYKHLVKALGREDLGTDSRFAENDERMKNKNELEIILNQLFSCKTTAEWEKLLIPNGVPVSAINDVKTLTERYPEAFVEVNHPVAGLQRLPGPPTVFSDAVVDSTVPAPRLGEHTDEILMMLGYDSDTIDTLHKTGIV